MLVGQASDRRIITVPHHKRPTIVDVAAAAGVSKSLVSMVLRGDRGPSAASREAVLDAVRALGYRPNRAAAILAAGRTNTIGVAIDDYRNLWYIPFFGGIRSVLAPLGVRVATADKTANEHLDVSPFDDLMSLRVDGIIVAAELPRGSALQSDVPVVIAGRRSNRMRGADLVSADEELGAVLAAEHLLDLGHRRIGHLAGSDGTAVPRREALAGRLRESGVEPIVVGGGNRGTARGGAPDTTERDGFELAMRLLSDHPETTAISAANDTMAFGAFGAARKLGLSVPGDLSIIGYDDSPLASTALLDLTTIDARHGDLGRVAALNLLQRIEDAATGVVHKTGVTTLQPRLLERSSTAAPRTASVGI